MTRRETSAFPAHGRPALHVPVYSHQAWRLQMKAAPVMTCIIEQMLVEA